MEKRKRNAEDSGSQPHPVIKVGRVVKMKLASFLGDYAKAAEKAESAGLPEKAKEYRLREIGKHIDELEFSKARELAKQYDISDGALQELYEKKIEESEKAENRTGYHAGAIARDAGLHERAIANFKKDRAYVLARDVAKKAGLHEVEQEMNDKIKEVIANLAKKGLYRNAQVYAEDAGFTELAEEMGKKDPDEQRIRARMAVLKEAYKEAHEKS